MCSQFNECANNSCTQDLFEPITLQCDVESFWNMVHLLRQFGKVFYLFIAIMIFTLSGIDLVGLENDLIYSYQTI